MTTTALRRPADTELGLGAVLLGLAAVGWVLTAGRMAGMDAGPGGELGGFGWFAASWLLMMAAMMLPALTPMAVAYGRTARPDAIAAFTAAYLLVWLAAGLVAYVAFELVRSSDLGFLAWDKAGRYVAAGAIAGAGVYQLTPLKRRCLRRCRDRATFLRDHGRPGRLGGLRMGLEHGVDCVGCSWALMVALFALGWMSLTWMALIAVLIAAERLGPPKTRLAVALVLLVLGASLAISPGAVPGLTVPTSEPMPGMSTG